jgi:hypothetical protein
VRRKLLREAFGEFDQNTPIGGVADFPEGDDEPQTFDDVQVDFIVAKQLQQFVPGVIGIVNAHRAGSGRPKKITGPEKDFGELAA